MKIYNTNATLLSSSLLPKDLILLFIVNLPITFLGGDGIVVLGELTGPSIGTTPGGLFVLTFFLQPHLSLIDVFLLFLKMTILKRYISN